MINKWAYKNPHHWIEILDVGSLEAYAAATAGNLQSRVFGTQTKNGAIKHQGLDPLQALDS